MLGPAASLRASLSRDEAALHLPRCVHSEAPGPFISFFIEVDVAMEHKSKDPEAKLEDA